MYPVAKIGDFGSSVLTFSGDAKNPDDYLELPTTRGYVSLLPRRFAHTITNDDN